MKGKSRLKNREGVGERADGREAETEIYRSSGALGRAESMGRDKPRWGEKRR